MKRTSDWAFSKAAAECGQRLFRTVRRERLSWLGGTVFVDRNTRE